MKNIFAALTLLTLLTVPAFAAVELKIGDTGRGDWNHCKSEDIIKEVLAEAEKNGGLASYKLFEARNCTSDMNLTTVKFVRMIGQVSTPNDEIITGIEALTEYGEVYFIVTSSKVTQ